MILSIHFGINRHFNPKIRHFHPENPYICRKIVSDEFVEIFHHSGVKY